MKLKLIFLAVISSIVFMSCSKSNGSSNGGGIITPPGNPPPTVTTADTINSWLTKADQSALLLKQNALVLSNTTNSYSSINVDSTSAFQTIDGFGYTLTGGSAQVINTLDANTKSSLLQELFGNTASSIGVSYLRISIGASDLNASVFSYDDMAGDTSLSQFSLAKDEVDLIPLLKQIVAINPSIKILATPWSAPTWMKDNDNSVGGSLLPQYYMVYANYFVKYIKAMQADGIMVDAITPQNEPLNPANNPSMMMTAEEETNFIKNNLGPAFTANTFTTKIICYDHNCDRPDYPVAVLSDADAAKYVDGSAFHLYAGDISALSTLHNDFPSKNVYFTEQYTPSNGSFSGDLQWHMQNVIIGSMNNWSKTALEWNLANDASFEPHTDGGCDVCKGALTISGGAITRMVGYYIVAQASKFVPAGSVRIASSSITGLYNVAFLTPSGKKVLLVLNNGSTAMSFNIKYKGDIVATSLLAGSVATYVW